MHNYKEKPYSFGFNDRVNLKIFSSLDVLLESWVWVFFLNIYLFIWLHQVLACGNFIATCGIFVAAYGILVVACGI